MAKEDRGSANWWLQKAATPAAPKAPKTPDAAAEILANRGDKQRGGPVPISYAPTRSSNPSDPRTAAAGYDPETKTLRVEWGDGGPAYNYYNVPPRVWKDFQRAPSPGKYINRVLNNYEYGRAE